MDLHENHELQSHGKRSIELVSGYKYLVEVLPSKVTASNNVAEVPMDKRNCIMHSDPFASFFYKKYSRKSCKVENTILNTIEKMQCLPWDAPLIKKNNFQACWDTENLRLGMKLLSKVSNDRKDAMDIIKALSGRKKSELQRHLFKGTTNCIESCEHTTYKDSVKVEPIDPGTECNWLKQQYLEQNVTPTFDYPNTLEAFLSPQFPPENYDNYFYEIMMLDPCHILMKNSIIVNLQPQDPPVHIVHMQKKISFSSQLATFGKYVIHSSIKG